MSDLFWGKVWLTPLKAFPHAIADKMQCLNGGEILNGKVAWVPIPLPLPSKQPTTDAESWQGYLSWKACFKNSVYVIGFLMLLLQRIWKVCLYACNKSRNGDSVTVKLRGGILPTFPDHIPVEKRLVLLLVRGNSKNRIVLIQHRKE
jgi:hypothetical protein